MNIYLTLYCFRLITLFLSILLFPHSAAADIHSIDVVINDPAPFHIHPPGQTFKISIKINALPNSNVSYTWKNFRGNTLSKPVPLTTGQFHTISSPSTEIGYYELLLISKSDIHALPNRKPSEERGYGFSIQSQPLLSRRSLSPTSKFGVVHADIEDPYLPTWAKTLTWKTLSVKWWGKEIQKRRALGVLELPIISRSVWKSDDSVLVSALQLDKLKDRVKSYFSASPSVLYWETGIEENLKPDYKKQYYWQNLERKLKVIRGVANEINPDIKLIYQIAGLKQKYVKNFAKSRASRLIDILSVHPYAWPDFPSPETWHDNYVMQVKQQLRAHGLELPIWYTEVGATHHGNTPGHFFGYPKKNNAVTGLTRYQATIYLIKLHVMAFQAGIEKVFWYNYQDRKPEREYAENHFGLRDYWGYPKPVYVAYTHLHRLLADKIAGKKRILAENIHVYEFSDNKTKVLVLWSFPATSTEKSVPIASLITELPQYQTIEIIDSMGRTVPFSGDSISVSNEPLFLIAK